MKRRAGTRPVEKVPVKRFRTLLVYRLLPRREPALVRWPTGQHVRILVRQPLNPKRSCDKGTLVAPGICLSRPTSTNQEVHAWTIQRTATVVVRRQPVWKWQMSISSFLLVPETTRNLRSAVWLPLWKKIRNGGPPNGLDDIATVFDNIKTNHIDATSNSGATAAEKKEQYKSVVKYLRREIAKLPERKVPVEKENIVASQDFLDAVPVGKKVDIVIPKEKTLTKLNNPAEACSEKDVDLSQQDNAYDVSLEQGETSLICQGSEAKTKLKRISASDYEYSCMDNGAWSAATAVQEDQSYTCSDGSKFYVNSLGGSTCAVQPPVSQSFPSVVSGTSGADCGTHIGEGSSCSYECTDNFLKAAAPSCGTGGVFTPAKCSCVHDGYVDNALGGCNPCPSGQFSTGGAACQPWSVTEYSCNSQNKVFVAGTISTDASCGITCSSGLVADGAICKVPSTKVTVRSWSGCTFRTPVATGWTERSHA